MCKTVGWGGGTWQNWGDFFLMFRSRSYPRFPPANSYWADPSVVHPCILFLHRTFQLLKLIKLQVLIKSSLFPIVNHSNLSNNHWESWPACRQLGILEDDWRFSISWSYHMSLCMTMSPLARKLSIVLDPCELEVHSNQLGRSYSS
jgi:hypothetical protein